MQRSQALLVLFSLLSGLPLGCDDAEEAQGSVNIGVKTYDVASVEAELIEGEDTSTLRLFASVRDDHMSSFMRVDVDFWALLPGSYEFFGHVELSPQADLLFGPEVPIPCQSVKGEEWSDAWGVQRVCLVHMPHGVTGLDVSMIQRVSGRIVVEELRGDEVRGEVSVWALAIESEDLDNSDPQELIDWPIYSGGIRASFPFVAKRNTSK